ncbi:MAG: glycoside hydrolase [Ruminococcus sp.]|nr:glycoside hydrolase [Ruminococcus sp.]
MKRTLCSAAALAVLASAPQVIPCARGSARAADVLKYEFENGSTSGGKLCKNGASDLDSDKIPEGADFSGCSGGGFAYLDQKGTTLSIEVDVPDAGLYELAIAYCEPSDPNKKVQYLDVNGVNQGEVTFPFSASFTETSGGVINLAKGKNTLTLRAYWGYTYFDYLTLSPADKSLTDLSPTRKLSNPKATEPAQRLYSYLCDQYGKHVIAGQQEYCGDHNYNQWNDPDTYIKDNEAEFEYILDKTGKQPAIRGIDMLSYNTTDTTWRDNATGRIIEWYNKFHGIPTVTWHWNVPLEEGSDKIAFYVESTGNTPYTTFSITNALKEGTWEHEKILADIDLLAGELKKVQDAGVPVLWRPLHEAEGGWFWWGAEGAEPCKKLYRLLYDKLTNEYGLNNLIWVWTGYTSPASADWYPGDDVVDIVGYDKYNAVDGLPNLSSIASTFYSLVKGTNGQKMVAMTENDSIPSLENLVNDKAAWLWFCPWYMDYLKSAQNNPVDNLIEIYNSDYCITLDELPDLSTYPINGGSELPSESSSANDTGNIASIPGDANCDGDVNMADAVLIMQSINNPDKYGKGTPDGITDEGETNGDVDEPGSGLTNKDALKIQKYKLGLIKSLI